MLQTCHSRRERDSNPRAVASKLISSQPRYDHFDISAYSIIRNSAGKLRTAHRVACTPIP